MISIAVAVAGWNVGTATFVDFSRPVADATLVVFANTRVFVIADAISIFVRSAVPTTEAKGVELVAVTVAIASRDV